MSWEVKHLTYEELETKLKKDGPMVSFPGFRGVMYLDMEFLPAGIRSVTVQGPIHADMLKVVPDNIIMEALEETVSLHGVEEIGNNVTIKAQGNIEIGTCVQSSQRWDYSSRYPSVTIGDNITLKSGYVILMACVVKIGNNAVISCPDRIDLNGLVEMGDNISIRSEWDEVALKSLTKMGKNVSLFGMYVLMRNIMQEDCTATVASRRGHFYKNKPACDPFSRKPLW